MVVYIKESNNREARKMAIEYGAMVKGSRFIFYNERSCNDFEMALKAKQYSV